jgi:hypothetical protein
MQNYYRIQESTWHHTSLGNLRPDGICGSFDYANEPKTQPKTPTFL